MLSATAVTTLDLDDLKLSVYSTLDDPWVNLINCTTQTQSHRARRLLLARRLRTRRQPPLQRDDLLYPRKLQPRCGLLQRHVRRPGATRADSDLPRDQPQHHEHGQRVRHPVPRSRILLERHGRPPHWRGAKEVSGLQHFLAFFTRSESGAYVALCRFVQIFFREERLPIAEGWTRPKTTITTQTLAPIEIAVGEASNFTATQQCEDLVIGPNAVI